MIKVERLNTSRTSVKFPDSDGFCSFQKIPKESGSIHGSEAVQLMRTGCETPRFPHMRGLLLATTENSRTRALCKRCYAPYHAIVPYLTLKVICLPHVTRAYSPHLPLNRCKLAYAPNHVIRLNFRVFETLPRLNA